MTGCTHGYRDTFFYPVIRIAVLQLYLQWFFYCQLIFRINASLLLIFLIRILV